MFINILNKFLIKNLLIKLQLIMSNFKLISDDNKIKLENQVSISNY